MHECDGDFHGDDFAALPRDYFLRRAHTHESRAGMAPMRDAIAPLPLAALGIDDRDTTIDKRRGLCWFTALSYRATMGFLDDGCHISHFGAGGDYWPRSPIGAGGRWRRRLTSGKRAAVTFFPAP